MNYSDMPLLRRRADAGASLTPPHRAVLLGSGVRAGRQNAPARATVPARTVSPANRRNTELARTGAPGCAVGSAGPRTEDRSGAAWVLSTLGGGCPCRLIRFDDRPKKFSGPSPRSWPEHTNAGGSDTRARKYGWQILSTNSPCNNGTRSGCGEVDCSKHSCGTRRATFSAVHPRLMVVHSRNDRGNPRRGQGQWPCVSKQKAS